MDMDGMKIDRISFQLGMINCFVEMVACGVKKMAISPPVTPQDYELVGEASGKMACRRHRSGYHRPQESGSG